jgi:DNA-binding NtrC family response regulator
MATMEHPCHDRLGRLVGRSKMMQKIFSQIGRVAKVSAPVLILGESGTGKELVAQAIHELSPSRNSPFVPIDCGALVPSLIESELFGHVGGAFTGAFQSRNGLLETVGSGTAFFDEVGELPTELQTRLLRVIQERRFRPVGGTQEVPFKGRVIAATNCNLREAMKHGRFREDLYFRLNVVAIEIPPLRDRKDDISLLAQDFLTRLAKLEPNVQSEVPWKISPEALVRLQEFDWPGNVRELENCLERTVALKFGPIINVHDLEMDVSLNLPSAILQSSDTVMPLVALEREAIEAALTVTMGDKVAAARLLGIGKTTLYRKLHSYHHRENGSGKRV